MAIRLMPERACVGCDHKVDWGCDAFQYREIEEGMQAEEAWVRPAYLSIVLDGEELYHCPRQTLYQHGLQWDRILMLYGMYKAGFMPEAGSVMDQSYRMIKTFRILDTVNKEIDDELAARKAKRKGDPRGHAS